MGIYRVLFERIYTILTLTLLTMGLFFRSCSRIRGTKKALLFKICLTYPTMMTLGTVMYYPKKIKNMDNSRNIPLEFC